MREEGRNGTIAAGGNRETRDAGNEMDASAAVTAAGEDPDALVIGAGFDAGTGGLTQIDLRGSSGRSLSELWSGGVHGREHSGQEAPASELRGVAELPRALQGICRVRLLGVSPELSATGSIMLDHADRMERKQTKEKVMSKSHGKYVWYELATSDVEGAKKFYGDVIGWGTDRFGGPEGDYTIWKAGAQGIGGAMTLPEEARKAGAPPRWVGYVYVDDVDAIVAKAKSLGGHEVVPPTDLPDVGRIAMVSDPQGAVIAMIKPNGPEAPWLDEVPDGHVSWNELLAGEQEAALHFYAELFGWQKEQAVPMPNGIYQLYGKHGHTLGGMMTRPTGYPAPPHWLYYVKVADLDAAIERVRKSGGKVMMGPMEVPGGSRIAQCTDPQGAAFALNGR